jgi:hypothetical protein
MDQLYGVAIVDFPAQVVNINVHYVGRGIKGKIPNVLNNHGARYFTSGIE